MPNPVTDFLTNRYLTTGSAASPTQPRADWGNIAKDLGAAAAIYGIINPNDSSGLASFFGTGGQQQPVGYTGGIPNYTATRELAPNAFTQTYTTPTGEVAPRVPGSAGRRYFTDTQFTQDTATPFMGITAEQIAAQNLAAQNELALFENILGGVETQRKTTAAEQAAFDGQMTTGQEAILRSITTPTGGITGIPATITPTGGTTTPTGGITTPTGGITTTDTTYTNFVNQFAGRGLTAEDAAALAGSGYSLNQLATSFGVDPTELRTFVNYYTNGSTTTDDGLVGTTGIGNLMVSLGGTRNADGSITDVTGGTYSIQDGAWRPVANTTPTGGITTPTGGTTPTAYDTFADSLRGRELTAEDAAAIVASGYSLNDLASTLSTATAPIDPLELRNFINYYTNGSTTTDDGLVGTTGIGNLMVSLGGTRNADGSITDVTGGTYSIQDGAWRPVANTTPTGGTTTTGTAPTAYDNFIASYAAKDVADFTAADYTALASSGYALSDIATSLNVTESSLANALDRYSPENVAFQNFMGSLPTTLSSAEHAQALLNSGYSLEKIASGYTNTTASQLQAFIDGFDTPTTTGTTTTGTTTTGADAVDTLLNSTEQGMVASGDYTDNGDGTITDSTNGYVYDNDTGEGYFPTTTGTTTTDTTGADAVETLLSSTEQWMVANRGYVDNGDGTITDSTNGYVYDADTGKGFFPTTNTTGTGETLTLNAADGTTSTIDLTGGAAPLTTTGTANPTAGPLAPTFDMVDASDFLSEQEQDIIYSVMKTSGANIADVAEEFGTTQDDVIEGLLRGGYETPEQIAATLNAVDPDIEFTEAQLIANLLEEGRTNPEEVAAYYKDHPVYGGITPEQVVTAFRDLGGQRKFAQGGNVNGYYLGGPTDGMADQIPATIDNMQPAALSDGEFVIPADVVSHLGNGNSDAGAKNLYSMMERVRTDRTGNPKQGKQIDPNKYLA